MDVTRIRPVPSRAPDAVDCPECRSAGSVYRDFFEVCHAEFGPGDRQGEPLRFTEVMDEIRRTGDLASRGAASGPDLAAACRRLERLLLALRNQFLEDVVLGLPSPVSKV